jgi:hypothetical protein
MTQRNPAFVRIIGPVLFLLVSLLVPTGIAAAQGDRSLIHIDGYLQFTDQGYNGAYRCLLLREHGNGETFALVGRVAGLLNGDHVRLEGRSAPGRCGARGFEVTKVQTVWADDNHRSTYYDHLHDGSFREWAVANQRLPPGYGSRRYR